MSKEFIITTRVDTTEIDLALEKAKELEEVLNRISKASEGLEHLNNLTDRMKKMNCKEKQFWLEDLKRIANVMQPNYDKPQRTE